MAYYAVYRSVSGELISLGTILAEVLPAGLVAVDLIIPPPDGHVWNAVSLAFVAPTPPRVIRKISFINRFTLAEEKELFGFNFGSTYTAAQQKNLASFMRYLDYLDFIDLDDAAIQQGVTYLGTVGILGVGRVAQVLA